MILAVAATLAIVVQDHAALRAAPSSGAAEMATLWQGDVLEVRGERPGYLKVYDYRRERGGYLKAEAARSIGLTQGDAPALLAVLRFLRDSPGSEALGVSYGAAYLKAVPTRALSAEPFDAIARMAERLADQASGTGSRLPDVAAHLEVVAQFGVHMRSFERNGRMQVCYEGELYRRVLSLRTASAEERAHAALGLTRPDCIDPNLGPALRASLDDLRRELLEGIDERQLSGPTLNRLHVRRATVWASIAFEQARRNDVSVAAGELGQTCVTLKATQGRRDVPLARRCTYGIVWTASARPIAQGRALVLAVQPLESWRELWVFHECAGAWTIDVLSPGLDNPEEGYVEFAGFAPGVMRLLIAREVRDRGRFRRRFEELRLDDLALVRQASTPDLLRDFGRWQDVDWRRDTLALH